MKRDKILSVLKMNIKNLPESLMLVLKRYGGLKNTFKKALELYRREGISGIKRGLGGVAGHSHKHFSRKSFGSARRLVLAQNLSAVTGACLVILKEVFDEINGLDEQNLAVAFNDVDFCLRVRQLGYRNLWTPQAELFHHEYATRGYEDTSEKQARFAKEVEYMKQRWGDQLRNDPAYSPNLTFDYEDFSYAWPPRVESI